MTTAIEIPAFRAEDFAIFTIGTFAEQIGTMREEVTPKLVAWGDALAPLLARKCGLDEMFSHVARHLRRKTTPPPETWAALAPRKRSYKSDPIFALTVSRDGVQARLMVKHEGYELRQRLGELLPSLAGEVAEGLGTAKLRDFYGRDFDARLPAPFDAADEDAWARICEQAARKTRAFDVGVAFTPGQSAKLTPRKVVNAFGKLLPMHAALMDAAGY